MRIQLLTATSVRNLRPLQLEPRERFNVFVGDNGQGKTNLLEAIYAVASLRSFRTSRLADMLAFGVSPDADERRIPRHRDLIEATKEYRGDTAGGRGEARGDTAGGWGEARGDVASGWGEARGDVASGRREYRGDTAGGRGEARGDVASGWGEARGDVASGWGEARGDVASGWGEARGDAASGRSEARVDVASGRGEDRIDTAGRPDEAARGRAEQADRLDEAQGGTDATRGRPEALEARIGARVVKDDLVRVYELTILPHGRQVLLDGKAARPLARYFGGFNVVVFTPEDLALPRGAPGDRRRFLDRTVFNARPDYLATVQDYEKALRQRNAVLKQTAQGVLAAARCEELLAVYDVQLAELGLRIANERGRIVDEIRVELAHAFDAITHSAHVASVRYASKSARSTVDAIIEQHRAGRVKDLATQSTQFGPHRDDLAFELDARDAGLFASQGQLRAIMLAWKTAELAVLARTHGDQPVLLLDDVSSELDPARNAYLFEHLAMQAGQVFITTTHPGHVLLARDRADYRIQNGEISS